MSATNWELNIEDIKIPRVEQFQYLGTVISKHTSSKNDLLLRNVSAKRAISILNRTLYYGAAINSTKK